MHIRQLKIVLVPVVLIMFILVSVPISLMLTERSPVRERTSLEGNPRMSEYDTRATMDVWSDDFESGDADWGYSNWYGLYTSQSHSSSHSNTDSSGNYADLADSRLYMNVGVDISGYNDAFFAFWHMKN